MEPFSIMRSGSVSTVKCSHPTHLMRCNGVPSVRTGLIDEFRYLFARLMTDYSFVVSIVKTTLAVFCRPAISGGAV